jgi:ribosomal protein S18
MTRYERLTRLQGLYISILTKDNLDYLDIIIKDGIMEQVQKMMKDKATELIAKEQRRLKQRRARAVRWLKRANNEELLYLHIDREYIKNFSIEQLKHFIELIKQ